MILIRGLKLRPDESESRLSAMVAKKLRVPESALKALKIVKKSLDARRKDDIHYSYSVAVQAEGDEARLIARAKSANIALYEEKEYEILPIAAEAKRPVIVGFGPAGMFAALVLAKAGARPIVIERGQDALRRKAAVDTFRAGGRLDTESNVQFGEGGAGTFSDGKLNTGTHDGRIAWVLRQFAEHGAPASVTYDAKPHIGTDILIDVVQNIRCKVISLGGEVHFGSKLTALELEGEKLVGAQIEDENGTYTLPCERLILAIGHSARDTFEALYAQGVPMQQKPFSMGLRIEHLQRDIDRAQYGAERSELPAADYSLNVHLPDGASAYTFCMCPGGEVIAAASEEGAIVTNGMSLSRRDGENANAAVLVTLHTEDFPGSGPLTGMYWQREIERAAFRKSGSYAAPAQLLGDFLARHASTGAGRVKPSYKPGIFWCDIHDVLPEKICSVVERALPLFGQKIKGFDDADAVLTAPETRSSSPVRIVRGADLSSEIRGLYPCGEGAGYAGGITSAAVDGMRCAEAVIKSYL